MNIIGLCQGNNFGLFSKLIDLTNDEINYQKVGIFVADYEIFKSQTKNNNFIDKYKVEVLKEWETIRVGLERNPNIENIQKWQKRYGDLSLWYGLLADRRLFFGKYCKSIQSYKPRLSEEKLMGILEEALENIELLFKKINPDIVFGFVPVTLHEYLIINYALVRKIPIRLLRSTKIENYISLNDSLFGLSNHIKNSFSMDFNIRTIKSVNNYIKKTKNRGAIYEGMHLEKYVYRDFLPLITISKIFKAIGLEIRRITDPISFFDTHNPGYLWPALIENVYQPFMASRIRRFLNKSGRLFKKSIERKYCLFPLHFEPEIALQIYARPFQNQIELARNIALSLPPGVHLVVKEHPRSIGVRPLKYYKKLLEIPNVLIAPFDSSSFDLVRNSILVSVITGNIGLEAAVLGKPVIVFGQTEYTELPVHMVKKCTNLFDLSKDINELIVNYSFNLKAIKGFLGSIVENSVPVDLYSTLYAKKGRHSFSTNNYEDQLLILKEYLIKRFTS